MRRVFLLLFVLAVAGSPALAQDLWLHVRVQEGGETGDRVRINMPLQLVQALLPTIQTAELDRGQLTIVDDLEQDGIDVRAAWAELRNAPDGEFITVQSNDEDVRVAKERDLFLVNVDGASEQVRVRVPIVVVDALFSSGGDELNLQAALEALAEFRGDLISVQDGTSTVRIWVDDVQDAE
jgi:hypothetical protein